MTYNFYEDDGFKRILAGYINHIIDEAITHGGDSGGPYCINNEGLIDAMSALRRWLGWKDYCIVTTEFGYAYAKPVEEEEKT